MSGDYFDKLVRRTRGRSLMAVSKLETMLAPVRGGAGATPELAKGDAPGVAANLSAPSLAPPRESAIEALPEVAAVARATEPVPLRISIDRVEIHAAPAPHKSESSLRPRLGLALSHYLDRRRR
jgi:hypothetical protein